MSATHRSHRAQGFRTLLAASALAAGAGCADNDISVYIRAIKAPVVMLNVCQTNLDPLTNLQTEGTLDLAFRRSYTMQPLLQNNIVARSDPQANRPEPNHVFIEGFIVEVHEDSPTGPFYRPAGSTFNNPFSVYQSVVIPPGLAGASGFSATFFEALPQEIGESLYQELCVAGMGIADVPGVPRGACVPRYNTSVQKRLIVSVSAFGHTGGNVSVLTPKFHFPVTACCGCLRNFPVSLMAAVDAGPGVTVNPSCAREMAVMTAASCPNYFGQDVPVPCGLCADSLPNVCEPTGHSFSAATVCPR